MKLDNFINQLQAIGITPSEQQLIQLEQYYELLIEYNKVMNLTGITEKEAVYLKHFYDSATLHQIINLSEQQSLCDIGTGAGFPGVVLKILFPHLQVTLVDSLNKRIQFLNTVIHTLGLEKIDTYHARAEEFAFTHREQYDVVTARAVANLTTLLEYCVPLVKVGKYFIPMKANINNELITAKGAMKKLSVCLVREINFQLPIEHSHRCLLMFCKQQKTAQCYPRKYSEIKKNPLS